MASHDQGGGPIRAAKSLLPASAACAQLHRACTVSANCGQASRPRQGVGVKTGGKRSGESRSLSEASREEGWRKRRLAASSPLHFEGERRRWASARCPRGGDATDAVRRRDKDGALKDVIWLLLA